MLSPCRPYGRSDFFPMRGKLSQLLHVWFPVYEYLEYIGAAMVANFVPPRIGADGTFQIDLADHDAFPLRKRSGHDFSLWRNDGAPTAGPLQVEHFYLLWRSTGLYSNNIGRTGEGMSDAGRLHTFTEVGAPPGRAGEPNPGVYLFTQAGQNMARKIA